MLGLICVTIWIALCSDVTQGATVYNAGNGLVHRLNVVQDVCLERQGTNFNYIPYLIVGLLKQFPKKRSLIQFEPINSSKCPLKKVRWAKMYLHFEYAHKAGWHSIHESPWLSAPIQVHRVKRSWKESEATSMFRMKGYYWYEDWLALNNVDAEAKAQACPKTIYTASPSGFVDFDVTEAVKSWISGEPNYGLLIWSTNEDKNGRGIRFASNANKNKKRHAYLQVMCDY